MSRVKEWGGQAAPLQLEGGTVFLHEPDRRALHDRIWELADGHVGFYGWLRVVNAQCHAVDCLSILDLPPRDWREDYDSRVPPDGAADVALDEFASEHGVGQP
jgi:hypothetical protein